VPTGQIVVKFSNVRNIRALQGDLSTHGAIQKKKVGSGGNILTLRAKDM